MKSTRIAIIGAGVSGLGVAYELRRAVLNGVKSIEIHIFEAQSQIGGNADSVVFSLGDSKPGRGDFIRWADLGVNDINLNAYNSVARVMREIEYYDKKVPEKWPNMRRLENTETFYNDESSVLVTDDSELEHGVSNPDYELARLDRGKQNARFWIKILFKAAKGKSWKNEKPNLELTVGNFFDAVVQDPRAELKEYTDEKIDWEDKDLPRVLENLATLYFKPRIAAMYFANDDGPENMLLAAPMCYYSTQEGQGGSGQEKADRRYFVGGSITWLRKLQQNLLSTELTEKNRVKIIFRDQYKARVKLTPDQIEISNGIGTDDDNEIFDQCIVTVHADDAAELLQIDPACPEHGVKKTLEMITYTDSKAYCHVFADLLPADRNQWRCYNVPIRDQQSKHKGYSMTYVCNRHQNDANDKAGPNSYNQAGLPQFFVTLNPQQPIPERFILQQADHGQLPGDLDAELVAPLAHSAPGLFHIRKSPGEPAMTSFKHNLLDRNCFTAQEKIAAFNAKATRLYFAGGWTWGSGLQEECWKQAETVAALISSNIGD